MILGGLFIIPLKTQAHKGDPDVKGPNYTQERHDAMTKAFINKDYNVWKTLMTGRGRVTQVVNDKNFARFAETHALALKGKTEEFGCIDRLPDNVKDLSAFTVLRYHRTLRVY